MLISPSMNISNASAYRYHTELHHLYFDAATNRQEALMGLDLELSEQR